MEVYRRHKHGQIRGGDRYLKIARGGRSLLAVIDGLGHGEEASIAADIACDSINSAGDMPFHQMVKQCASDLSGSRGVAIAITERAFNEDTVQYACIGNVETFLISSHRSIALERKPGVFGRGPRSVQIKSLHFKPGNRLLMHTDGIGQLPPTLVNQLSRMSTRHVVQVLADRWDGADDVCILCDELVDG